MREKCGIRHSGQRRFGTLLRQGLGMTAVSLVLRWLGLRFGTLIAARAGTDVVGLSSLAGGTVGFAVTLCSAGVGLGCTQLVSEGMGREDPLFVRRALATALRYSLLLGTVTAAGLFLLSEPIARYILKDSRTVAYLRLHAFSLPAISLGGCVSGYLASLKRAPLGAIVRTIGEFARAGLLLFLFSSAWQPEAGDAARSLFFLSVCDLFTEWGVLIATLTLLPAIVHKSGVKGVFSLCLLPKGNRGGCDRGERSVRMRYLQTVVPLAVSACFRAALLHAEHLLIPDTLVHYGMTRKNALSTFGLLHGMVFPFVLLPSAAVASFGGLLIPEVAESRARGDTERIRMLAHKALSLTLLFSAGIGGCFFVFSEEAANILFHSPDAAAEIRWFSLLVPVMYTDMMTDVFLKGYGEHVYSMKINILDALLSLLLVAVTIPRFGIYGYMAGVWFTESFNLLLSFIRLRRHLRPDIHPLQYAILPLMGMAAIATVLRRILPVPRNTASLVLCILTSLLCYGILLPALYVLRKSLQSKEKRYC